MAQDLIVSYDSIDIDPLSLPAALRASIEAGRDETDQLGKLPPALLDQLRASGVFRLLTPRELGGFETGIETAFGIYEELARIDGPVAWIIWNANLGLSAAILSPEGTAKVWAAGPDPVIVNSGQPGRAVPVDGGFTLSGRWNIVSGVDSADWAALFALVFDGEQPRMTETGPDIRLFLVPRQDLTVLDTWQVGGMRGSGSNTVVIEDAFVPADLAGKFLEPARIDRPLYRIPAFSVVGPGCAAVVLGMARAAIDEIVALAPTKRNMFGAALAEQSHVQATLGRSDAALRAASLLLRSTAADIDRAATAGEPITVAQRAELRGAMSHANQVSREVLSSMYELGSSTSLYLSNRIERIFRDGMAAAQAANLAATHFELAGRVQLGLDPGTPVF